MCAGPYSQLLLGIPSSLVDTGDSSSSSSLNAHFLARNAAIENAVLDKQEVW